MAVQQSQDGFDKIADVPVNEELIDALLKAGASKKLVNIVAMDPDDIPVQNSPREQVQKFCYWHGEISVEAIEEERGKAYGAFDSMWNGTNGAFDPDHSWLWNNA